METLIINVPDEKSALIKEILKQFGVSFKKSDSLPNKPSDYIGAIPSKTAKEILKSVVDSREKWERDI